LRSIKFFAHHLYKFQYFFLGLPLDLDRFFDDIPEELFVLDTFSFFMLLPPPLFPDPELVADVFETCEHNFD